MRRALRIFAKVGAGLLLLVALLIGGLYIAGNSSSGRVMIERLTLRLTSGNVKLTGLSGSFPEQLFVEKLELRDEKGIWLTAERVRLRWTAWAYLAGRLQIDDLQVAHLDMERLPVSSSKPHDDKPVSIPRIDAAQVSIELLELGPQLAGASTSLVVKGSAHLRSVQDMSFDAAARRLNGEGEYQLQLRFDSKRMDANLKLQEPAGGPLENLIQLPGLGALAATLNFNGPRTAERLDLSIDAGALRGRAKGSLNLTDLSADLDFDFSSPASSPRADLSWDQAALKGRWHGSIKSPVADGHLQVSRLKLPGAVEMASISADLAASSGKATLQGMIEGLRIPGPRPEILKDSPLKLSASMSLDDAARPLDVVASHRLFSLNGRAETAEMSSGKHSAAVQLRLFNLTPLAEIAGQTVHGTALVEAHVKGDRDSTRVTVDASAALVVGTEIWSQAVGDRATLEFTGSVTDQALRLDSAKFAGRAVALNADGSISRAPAGSSPAAAPALSLRWDVNVSDLHTLAAALSGTARAAGTLQGPTHSMAGEAQVTSSVSVRGSPSGTVSAEIKMRGLPASPTGTLTAHGSLDGAPLFVDVELQKAAAGTVDTLIRRAEWRSVHADGEITVAGGAAQSHGQLRLEVGQLSDLDHLLGSDLGGALSGTVMLSSAQGRTRAQYHFEGRNLATGTLVGNVQLTGEAVADVLGFKVDAQLPKLRGAPASASAAGSVDLSAHEIHIAEATANYKGQDARLLSAARLSYSTGFSVDEIKIGAQKAVFDLQGQISPTLDLRASLRQVEPSLVNVFAPGLLESGTLDGHAKLQGTTAAPSGEIQLTGKDMRLADDAALGLPPLDLKADAQLEGNTANLDARLVAGDASKMNVLGHVPLASDGALDLKINGSLDVGMINPLLEARGQHATGQLAVDAMVTGSVEDPQIGGTVVLTKGSWRDYARGLSVTDIAAEVVGERGRLQIKKFAAAAAPGTIDVTGSVGVLEKGIPVDLKITAANAQPIVSKLVTSNLNADLQVKGTAREHLDISGKVRLNRTLVGIPNGLPPNVAVLDVRRRGKPAPSAPDKELVIGLDVSVQASQEILVQGRGLDAEVGGELHLGGTTESPVVSGGFDLVRGSFSLGSSKLNFTPPGSVSFDGNGLKNKIDPTLDFTAQTTVQEVTATLRISGPADSPQFEFTSSPAKQPDEIMALLLFGNANPASLTGIQYAQVGAALATLSGVGGDGGLNPLIKIQRTLGLDRLTVGAATTNTTGAENTGASIEAGRYISKRVYVEAKQSSTGSSQLQADIDLTKHLKLQTRLGNGTVSAQGTTPENDPGSSVGLSYQFEY